MGDRANNIGKMMNDPKQRNMYLMGAGVVILTLGVGFFISTRNNNQQVSAGADVTGVPSGVKAAPGVSNNPQYVQAVKDNNDKLTNQAIKQGNGYMPTLTANTPSGPSVIDELDKKQKEEIAKKAAIEAEKKIKDDEEKVRLEDESKKQQALLAAQQPVEVVKNNVSTPMPVRVEAPKKYSTDDYMLIASLTGSWGTKKSNSEYDFAKGQNKSSSQSSSSNVTQQSSTTQPVVQAKPLAKLGTIFNAILETGINSDEPSPVLARIVSGPLKGTRLIGQISTVGEKVLIVFNSANIPGSEKSIRMSAYAVDTNTSRTALADDVDHHYFLRYGVLLATSFIGGYAQALQQSGATTTAGISGTTTTNPVYTNEQLNNIALGSVGQKIAQDTQQQFGNLKPTITVNSGAAIGVLLMEDLMVK
jgi:intracellular multiplication protein IcmE